MARETSSPGKALPEDRNRTVSLRRILSGRGKSFHFSTFALGSKRSRGGGRGGDPREEPRGRRNDGAAPFNDRRNSLNAPSSPMVLLHKEQSKPIKKAQQDPKKFQSFPFSPCDSGRAHFPHFGKKGSLKLGLIFDLTFFSGFFPQKSNLNIPVGKFCQGIRYYRRGT